MKKTLLKGIAAAAVIGAGLMMPTSNAAADSFRISVGTPHVGVTFGKHDDHRYHRSHDYHHRGHHDYGYRESYRGKHHKHGHHKSHPGKGHYKKRGKGHYKHHKHHRGHDEKYYAYDRSRHVCRYDQRPVTKYYYDDCGDRVYYTAYETVRLCDSYHRHH